MASKDKIVRVRCRCSNCGGSPRNHRVICSHKVKWDTVDIYGFTAYEIVKCMGCDSVRFRVSETNSEDMDWDEDSGTAVFTEFERGIYPDDVPGRRQAEDVSQYPDNVAKMYLEMIKCFNAGALTLAGGGLQAIVEAICQEQQATGRSLETRIDGLVTQGYLVQAEADLLHEERYIRNFALHEMKTPTKADLEDGLKIVEGRMNTIYVLPFRAARLRASETGQASLCCRRLDHTKARVLRVILHLVNCSGPQTAAPGPANKGRFRLTFRANKRRLGPTITANEPTFCANSLQTALSTHIRCQ